MIPKTLSATSIDTAVDCMRRWEGEMYGRMGRTTGRAANLGSTVHGALENYVREVYIDKTWKADLDRLLAWYQVEAINLWGTTDFEEYNDGEEMLRKWFERTNFDNVKVMSVEQKLNFNLPTSVGDITFNYIFDRLDDLGNGEYRVVDYKSNRWGLTPSQLHGRTQARVYALAAAIMLRGQGIEAKYIWVEFDLLRHDTVGTRFTRDENVATWNKLIEVAETIIKTPEGTATPTLNSKCLFCQVKATCPALTSNINHGGIFSLPIEQQIDLRAQLEYQKKALVSALSELDEHIIARAKEEDEVQYVSSKNRLSLVVSQRRGVDPDMVEREVGTQLFERYGGKTLTLANFNKLLKDPAILPEKRRSLEALISVKLGEPSVKIDPLEFL